MSDPAALLIFALAQGGGTADPPWRPCVARVVDGATHVPVAGVEVYWLDRDLLSPDNELSPDDAPFVRARELVPEEWIRRLGHHATSDASGDVALPAKRGEFSERIVVAWHDGKFARCDRGWEFSASRVVPLELEDDTAQLVRVVDGAGAPLAGVEVAAWSYPNGYCGNGGPCNDHIWSEPTDAKGEVKLPHAQWFFRRDSERIGVREQLHAVGLGLPVREPNWVGLEARKGDPPAIELVAPTLESVELELQSESGERCTAPAWVALASLEERRSMEEVLGTGRPFGYSLARDGRLLLRNVERGMPLLVAYTDGPVCGWGWDDVEVPAADPGANGAPRAVRANRRFVEIRGRAIDRESRPWAHASIGTDWEYLEQDQDATALLTPSNFMISDLDGRFSWSVTSVELHLFPDGRDSDWYVALAFEDRGLCPAFGAPTRVSIRDVHATSETMIDLGDVVLAAPALRVGGRVVDTSGRPLPHARIGVRDRAEDDQSRQCVSVDATTDDDGRFVLHTGKFEKELYFTSWESGWRVAGVRTRPGETMMPATTPVPLGAGDVEVVLSQYAGVRGRVLFADGMHARDLDLSIGEGVGRLDFYPDGIFEARVASDVVSIEVRSKADGKLLATKKALVPESGVFDDPDLVIDLRPFAKGR